MEYKLKDLKDFYKKEGFIIEGIVGSFARGDFTKSSDVDIVYSVDYEKFLKKNGGFLSFKRVEEIKREIENVLKRRVDLINKKYMNEIAKKYMLKDFVEI